MSKEKIKVSGEYIKLQDLLRGKKLRTGDEVEFDGKIIEVIMV